MREGGDCEDVKGGNEIGCFNHRAWGWSVGWVMYTEKAEVKELQHWERYRWNGEILGISSEIIL